MRRPGGHSSAQPVGIGNHQGNRSREAESLFTRGGVYDQQPTRTSLQLERKANYRQEAQTQHYFGGTCTNSRQGASHSQQNYLGFGSTAPQQQQFRRGFQAPTEIRHTPYQVPVMSSPAQPVPQGQHQQYQQYQQYQQQHGWTAGGRSHGRAPYQGYHLGIYQGNHHYLPNPTRQLPQGYPYPAPIPSLIRPGLPPEPPPAGFPLNSGRSQHYASYFSPAQPPPLVPNPHVWHRGSSFPSSNPPGPPYPSGLPYPANPAGPLGNPATGSLPPSRRTPLPSGPVRPQPAPQRGPAPRKPLPSSRKAPQGSRQVHKAVQRAQQAARKDQQRPMRPPPAPTPAPARLPIAQPQPTEPSNPADTDPSHPSHPSHQAYLVHVALRAHETRQARQAYETYEDQVDRGALYAQGQPAPRSRFHLAEPARPAVQLAYRPSSAADVPPTVAVEGGVSDQPRWTNRDGRSGMAMGGVMTSGMEVDGLPRLPNPRFFPEVLPPAGSAPEGASEPGRIKQERQD
ncbi:hypothetical protein B0J18DRAFT_184422 [Chaetomium sp. MPI-SDFR-AT-0129]|nr:hypothetical protein B0J18DRAFT_184422 [Chaetomium sp. MPI-SDFR-AT-0129]